MLKLQTRVECGTSPVKLSFSEGTVLLGSCFADNVGSYMSDAGFDVCVNPFGTLYNPVSVRDAVARLESGTPFGLEDCVEMGEVTRENLELRVMGGFIICLPHKLSVEVRGE